MTEPAWRVGLAEGFVGDARKVLAALEPASVHLSICSPPFFALRRYSGEQEVVWGGDPEHVHEWAWREQPGRSGGTASAKVQIKGMENFQIVPPSSNAVCPCGATLCALGLEAIPDCGRPGNVNCGRCYICHLREIFAGVWRVLRADGVAVIEIGSSYAGSWGAQGHRETPVNLSGNQIANAPRFGSGTGSRSGLKPKDDMLIPSRLALALQADGWYVRSVAPWVRRSAMPESVLDRPSSALSWVLMLAKSSRYFWDMEAVRKPHSREWDDRNGGSLGARSSYSVSAGAPTAHVRMDAPALPNPAGRSFRNTDPYFDSLDYAIEQAAADLARLKALRANGGVLADDCGVPLALDVNPEPSSLAHFAAWPSRLIRPWILAACPERACAVCGKGWVRVVETVGTVSYGGGVRKRADAPGAALSESSAFRTGQGSIKGTIGFAPACDHAAPTLPGTVLDIFGGSGTTALVANRLGRRSISVDLSAEYAEMARRRLEGDAPMLNALQERERETARQTSLFDLTELAL